MTIIQSQPVGVVSLYTIGMAVLAFVVLVLCALTIVTPRSVRLSLRSVERPVGTPPAAVLGATTVGLLLLTLGRRSRWLTGAAPCSRSSAAATSPRCSS